MKTLGVLGSCLSNLTGTFLTSEYKWERLNNSVVRRSDHFRRYFVERSTEMPAYKPMFEFLGVKGTSDADYGWICLNDDYRERAGRHAMDSAIPSFIENLESNTFDVFLLDNLFDTHHPCLHYQGSDIDPFSTTIGLHLFDNCAKIAPSFEVEGALSAERSAENWIAIIRYLRAMQPRARFFFTCAHYCTSEDRPERYQRAIDFNRHFSAMVGDLPIDIVPPLNVPKELTKLPDDRDHLDMTIYRGLAGQFYLSVMASLRLGGTRYEDVRAADADTQSAAIQLPVEPFSLTEAVRELLTLSAGSVNEDSGMNATTGWDSLRQLQVLTHVEAVSQVKFSFQEITDLTTIRQIRAALNSRGVAMSDDPVFAPGLFSPFVRRAVTRPDASYAIVLKGGVEHDITNRWILSTAAGLGACLADVAAGSIAVIVLEHSEHLYSSFIGCVLHGIIPTILPPLTAKQDVNVFRSSMEVLFDRIKPAVVITSKTASAALPATGVAFIDVDKVQPRDWSDVLSRVPDLLRPVGRSDVAFLQHSSGTTGHKKGVMLSHPQVAAQIRLYADSIELAPGDVIASWLPLYHDMGLITSFLMPTMTGCRIISLDALEWVVAPTMLLDVVEKFRAGYAWLPNFAFHHIVRADRHDRTWDLSSIKAIVSCSEPCRGAAFGVFMSRFSAMGLRPESLKVSYAMAENVFAVTQTPASEAARRGSLPALEPYLSSGRCLPGVDIEIRDAQGDKVADGDLGEICIRSSCLFDGYYKMPDVTAERMENGWYHTRDLGAVDDGELFVIGRVDDLLIINGKNVVAHELEDALSAVDGVAPGRILINSAYDEDSGATRLMVLAEPLTASIDASALSDALHDSVFALSGIPPHKVQILPKGFLLKSTSGKLSRSASLRKFEETAG